MDFDSRLVAGYTTCCSPLHGKSRTDFTRCGAAERFVIRGSIESLGLEGEQQSYSSGTSFASVEGMRDTRPSFTLPSHFLRFGVAGLSTGL